MLAPATPAWGVNTNPTITSMGVVTSATAVNGWDFLRDSGYSAQYSISGTKRSFWVFSDTIVKHPSNYTTDWQQPPETPAWFRNNTAAVTTFDASYAPTGLEERGTFGVPRQFVPDPNPVYMDCSPGPGVNGEVTWVTGAAAIPGTQKVIVSHETHCLGYTPGNQNNQVRGIMTYDPVNDTVVSNAAHVFESDTPLSAARRIASPTVSPDGQKLYFVSLDPCGLLEECVGQLRILKVDLGSTPATTRPWETLANYRWWNGTTSTWTSQSSGSTSVITDPVFHPLGVTMTYQDRIGKYVLVETRDMGGGFRIWTATDPTGPWTNAVEGQLPCNTTGGRTCRAIIPHAEHGGYASVALSFYQGGPTSGSASANDDRVLMARVTL